MTHQLSNFYNLNLFRVCTLSTLSYTPMLPINQTFPSFLHMNLSAFNMNIFEQEDKCSDGICGWEPSIYLENLYSYYNLKSPSTIRLQFLCPNIILACSLKWQDKALECCLLATIKLRILSK